MYKFSNGVVVFTIEDRDNFIKAGYTLVEEKKEDKENHAKKEDSDRIIEEKPRRSNTESKRVSRIFR